RMNPRYFRTDVAVPLRRLACGELTLQRALEVAALGEAVNGSARDCDRLAVTQRALAADEHPAMGGFPGILLVVGKLAGGLPQRDRAAEIALGSHAVAELVKGIAAELSLDFDAVRVLLLAFLEEGQRLFRSPHRAGQHVRTHHPALDE